MTFNQWGGGGGGEGGRGINDGKAELWCKSGVATKSEGSHAHIGSWTAQEIHHVDSGCFEIVSSSTTIVNMLAGSLNVL